MKANGQRGKMFCQGLPVAALHFSAFCRDSIRNSSKAFRLRSAVAERQRSVTGRNRPGEAYKANRRFSICFSGNLCADSFGLPFVCVGTEGLPGGPHMFVIAYNTLKQRRPKARSSYRYPVCVSVIVTKTRCFVQALSSKIYNPPQFLRSLFPCLKIASRD